jgi:acyl transferase domain-containing protein
LEVSAITQTFGKSNRNQKLVVGSVKASVGHLEAGAALIGIIKTIECLERGMIPAQKHFSIPNPKIDFTHVQIPTSCSSGLTLQDYPDVPRLILSDSEEPIVILF